MKIAEQLNAIADILDTTLERSLAEDLRTIAKRNLFTVKVVEADEETGDERILDALDGFELEFDVVGDDDEEHQVKVRFLQQQ